jgi:hypothetical protein
LADCITTPVTPVEEIMANKNLMKYQMEAFITNLQGKIIRKFQELEPDKKFIVDKWSRKEVCIDQNIITYLLLS